MGKVRTETVKRLANELVQKYPDRFTKLFEDNKKTVEELVNYESKKLRNLIAGYVTTLKCIEETRASLPVVEEEETAPEESEVEGSV